MGALALEDIAAVEASGKLGLQGREVGLLADGHLGHGRLTGLSQITPSGARDRGGEHRFADAALPVDPEVGADAALLSPTVEIRTAALELASAPRVALSGSECVR